MESLIKSMLGKDETFVLDRLQSFIKNEDKVKDQEKEIDNLKEDIENLREENHYLKNKIENKMEIMDDMENDLDKFEIRYRDAEKAMESKEFELREWRSLF